MNLNQKLFINPQIEFAISNNDVLVKTQFKIFRLSGDTVTSYLIPALPYLEKGISLSALATQASIKNIDKFIKDVIQPMLNRRWLTLDTESITLDNKLQISNAFSSVGFNGVEVINYLATKKVAVVGLSDFALDIIPNLQEYFGKVELFLPYTTPVNGVNFTGYNTSDLKSLFANLKENDLVIFTESKENTHFEHQLNRLAFKSGVKILFTRVSGFNISIGPTVIPKNTGCLECLNFRQMNNSSFSKEFMAFNNGNQFGAFPNDGNSVDFNTKTTMVGMLVAEVVRLLLLEKVLYKDGITLEMPGTLNTVIEFNTITNTLNSNSFLKNPRCLVCGSNLYKIPEIKPWMESYTYPEKKDGQKK